MDRRSFVTKSLMFTTGCLSLGNVRCFASDTDLSSGPSDKIYELFRVPGTQYHPYVRWWWNGNKVEAGELVRELRLLKEAGIGGVEINPVQFPSRYPGDDLGKASLEWLSDEWIDMLSLVFSEAKALGMTCDLIVGSGWPFGAEYLEGEEQSQVVVIAVKKITGPVNFEITKEEIFAEADPEVSSPFPGRMMELLSLSLVPDPMSDFEQLMNLSDQLSSDIIKIPVPEGHHALYALVKVRGFMQVINGAPGATGPVLNHYNEDAVRKYLNRMSEAIEKKTGPLSLNIRALFADSMELEGANWSADMMDEFRQRRGYDIFPYLPFILFRTGAMGNTTDPDYGVVMGSGPEEMVRRMRYDFEVTKAELLEERFLKAFAGWCSNLGVKSRMQAYGRGFFPLESSFYPDIPECESWTMNWLKHKVGEEMPESDYRRGRAYTMINKYVSSAAHLAGKKLVSCEEMTDTYTVFNTSLENLKIGGDQSAISGVTHSVFHGFNYSPPEAPYPGWLRYGGYFNEKNNWWPYFHLYNEYKGRLSSVFQNVTMFADIAIVPPDGDMWSDTGAQSEPFPVTAYVDYMTLIWEAIVKNGSGCDYISERVLSNSEIKDGLIHYGRRRYHTIFLVRVKSLGPVAVSRLLDFVKTGGRIFCLECFPEKSPGWRDHENRDHEVKRLVEKMQAFHKDFILLKRPEKDFINWYRQLQKDYSIKPYVHIDNPNPFVMQARYQADDLTEMVYIINSNLHNSHITRIRFSGTIARRRHVWLWDPVSGEKYVVPLSEDNGVDLDMGPGDSFLFVFDRNTEGEKWISLPSVGDSPEEIQKGWSAEFIHCNEGWVKKSEIDMLRDLKESPEYANFSGSIIYRNRFYSGDTKGQVINLGKVYGVTELKINGRECGTRWYGRRLFSIEEYLNQGENSIEIKVVTSMGNYMKSLTGNRIAQYWTNEKNKIQPLQSMGLAGPVTIYRI